MLYRRRHWRRSSATISVKVKVDSLLWFVTGFRKSRHATGVEEFVGERDAADVLTFACEPKADFISGTGMVQPTNEYEATPLLWVSS